MFFNLYALMEDKITIDQQTFKALAAESRVHILKLLGKRRHTQSELSAELKLSVPTVKEHLEALEKAGLVNKYEEGYKWKYYGLTEKGKCLLDPERKKVWILLTSLIVSITAGVLAFFSNFLFAGSMARVASSKSLMASESAQAANVLSAAPYQLNVLLTLSIVFFAAAVVSAILLMYYSRKSRAFRKH